MDTAHPLPDAAADRETTRLQMTGWPRARLREWFAQRGFSEPHARAVFTVMHRQGVVDPRALEGVGVQLEPRLIGELEGVPVGDDLRVTGVDHARDGTVKLLLETPAGDAVECVIIPQGERRTLCLSSQVGCAVGCPFCSTGTMGLKRNLAAWEIVAQMRIAREHAGRPIDNVVFMGMGEPLANLDAVVDACVVLGDSLGLGLPRRRLVVSTAGVVSQLRPFWERRAGVLAVSLHAARDELRDRLVPLNRRWNLAALRQALLDLPLGKRESITIEYVLLADTNDSIDDAGLLADWCRGLPVKVNLIELNPFPGSPFQRTPRDRALAFRHTLIQSGLVATLRHSRGDDIQAACGQLAASSSTLR